MPGEFVEIHSTELEHFNGEVSIEPRRESPLGGQWPERSLTRVIQGSVRIPNLGDEPLHISKSQQIAQIRRVTMPSTTSTQSAQFPSALATLTETNTSQDVLFSDKVTIDPDGQLSVKDRLAFRNHQ